MALPLVPDERNATTRRASVSTRQQRHAATVHGKGGGKMGRRMQTTTRRCSELSYIMNPATVEETVV